VVSLKKVTNADTGTADIVGGDDWDSLSTYVENFVNSPDFSLYNIYKSGSTYYSKNGLTKAITSGSVASTVIQSAITAVLASSRGGILQFSADDFVMDTYLDIPTATTPKPIAFRGVPSLNRSYGTYFSTSASFPTNRYFIETSGATDGSNKYVPLYVKDIGMYNLNIGVLDAGGIKYEIDSPDFKRPIIVDGLRTNYLYRDIHLIGPVWWGLFNDINATGASASFTTGADNVKLEQGTHTAGGINPWPKACVFSNILIDYVGGGTFANSLNADAAGYNVFRNWQVEGGKFTNAIFYFTNKATDNVLENPLVIDITAPTPDNRVGTVVFDGAGVYNNHVHDGKLPRNGPTSSGYTVAFKNGAYRNYAEISGKWGSTVLVDNVGTGDYNIVSVMPDSEGTAATVPTKIAFTGSAAEIAKIKVIDQRKGFVADALSATQSGNNSTTVFNIAHGLNAAPVYTGATAYTSDSLGSFTVTSDATNVIITYSIPPPTGTNNLRWNWRANCY
jgi:hypothetical protein